MEWLSDLAWWHWMILAAVLMVVEVLAPAAFFIWISVAAALVGVGMLIFPDMSWQLQSLLFSAIAIASVVGGRRFIKPDPTIEDSTLNRRGEQYIGRVLTLDEAIENGAGRVRVDDTYWRVVGPNAAAGSNVKVNSVEGSSLIVDIAET